MDKYTFNLVEIKHIITPDSVEIPQFTVSCKVHLFANSIPFEVKLNRIDSTLATFVNGELEKLHEMKHLQLIREEFVYHLKKFVCNYPM